MEKNDRKTIKNERIITHEVVEDLILKGYYNKFNAQPLFTVVVEDLILKGYYNCKNTDYCKRGV